MIIPLFDYADFMVESASKVKIAKLEKLQEKALKCIGNMCQKCRCRSSIWKIWDTTPVSEIS